MKKNDTKSKKFCNFLRQGLPLVTAGTVNYFACVSPEKPLLVAIAGALGVTFDMICNTVLDTSEKNLSSREKIRTAACALYTINRISARLANGDNPREDDFFKRDINSKRAPSEEIFEGILIAAKNEHEEKKTKFLGNLVANISFDPTITKSKANFLIKIMERLNYDQLCIIAIFQEEGQKRLNWGFSFTWYEELMTLNYLEVSMEELYSLKIIGSVRGGGGTFGSAALNKFGQDLYRLASLDELESEDKLKIKQDFLKVEKVITQNKY